MPLPEVEKLMLLKFIADKKEVLFGPKTKASNHDKQNAWHWVIEQCQTVCGFNPIPEDHTWSYVRDTTWGNYRRTALVKLQQKGGVDPNDKDFTEVDLAVLAILGEVDESVVRNEPYQDHESTNAMDGTSYNEGATASGTKTRGRLRSVHRPNSTRRLLHTSERTSSSRAVVAAASTARRAAARRQTQMRNATTAAGHSATVSASSVLDSSVDDLLEERRKNIQLQNELLEAQINYWKLKAEAVKMNIREGCIPCNDTEVNFDAEESVHNLPC